MCLKGHCHVAVAVEHDQLLNRCYGGTRKEIRFEVMECQWYFQQKEAHVGG